MEPTEIRIVMDFLEYFKNKGDLTNDEQKMFSKAMSILSHESRRNVVAPVGKGLSAIPAAQYEKEQVEKEAKAKAQAKKK